MDEEQLIISSVETCQFCSRELTEDDSNLCLRCEGIQADAEHEAFLEHERW